MVARHQLRRLPSDYASVIVGRAPNTRARHHAVWNALLERALAAFVRATCADLHRARERLAVAVVAITSRTI